MKRWWRLLWIVAASVLPAWPGHGVPLCPLPAAPTSAFFGTDPLANGNPIGSGGDLFPNGPLDRLVSRDNGAVLLGYNGDGARVRKTVGGTTTFYLVDDRNLTGYAEVVEEHQSVNGGAATLTAVYTHGLDLIAQRRAGSVRYFSYDGHGSTRLLTDTSGAVTDTYLYDAYGTLLTSSGSTPNNYLYCGEQFDPDLGMYSLRARFYQPQTGRFWTMDSWEGTQTDPLSLHKYLYAGDDPVNMTDPSGHDYNYISLLSASAIGATIGALSAGAVAEAQGRTVTLSEVLWGASIGAVLGPVAVVYAPAAVGLGIGGFVYSGISFGPILFDPGATPEQRRASAVLIAASIYGAHAGMKMARAPVQTFKGVPTEPPGDYVVLEHGTTMTRALGIFRDGPDPTFVELGGSHTTPAGGVSMVEVGAQTPVGSPAAYAAGKATIFQNEGGGAVIRIAVPRAIYDKALKTTGEVRFTRGHGLEELRAEWLKTIYRFPPKKVGGNE